MANFTRALQELRQERSRAQQEVGRLDEAIQAFQRAAQADPKLPGIHMALAQIYVQQGKTEQARREIEQELALVPDSLAAKTIQEKIPSGEPQR